MKTVAFVPVKLNNERTPGKNIKRFTDGTPLIHFVQQSLLKLKKSCIDEIYVYCSDEAVVPYLLDGVLFLRRPEYLDKKEVKGTQIYEEFVNTIGADVYVLAHATSPFILPEHIEDCVKKVQLGEYDSAFCAKKIQNFLWKNKQPLNFELNNPLRTQDMEPIYMELSTPYVFTRDLFKKYHSRSGIQPYICECSEVETIDIDYPEDFELADIIYTNLLSRHMQRGGI